MRLHEQTVGTRGDGCLGEGRNELACTTTRTADALPRLLHAVGRVEDHRHVAGGAHASEATHVDDEIAVAEERAAFGEGNLGVTRRSLRAEREAA